MHDHCSARRRGHRRARRGGSGVSGAFGRVGGRLERTGRLRKRQRERCVVVAAAALAAAAAAPTTSTTGADERETESAPASNTVRLVRDSRAGEQSAGMLARADRERAFRVDGKGRRVRRQRVSRHRVDGARVLLHAHGRELRGVQGAGHRGHALPQQRGGEFLREVQKIVAGRVHHELHGVRSPVGGYGRLRANVRRHI
ncbi:hypothetical protein FGB62_25g251 [Gracilaria domingensis]|nr:hypothetical protein FGB62_25g251 [Gracilaria domingensis]